MQFCAIETRENERFHAVPYKLTHVILSKRTRERIRENPLKNVRESDSHKKIHVTLGHQTRFVPVKRPSKRTRERSRVVSSSQCALSRTKECAKQNPVRKNTGTISLKYVPKIQCIWCKYSLRKPFYSLQKLTRDFHVKELAQSRVKGLLQSRHKKRAQICKFREEDFVQFCAIEKKSGKFRAVLNKLMHVILSKRTRENSVKEFISHPFKRMWEIVISIKNSRNPGQPNALFPIQENELYPVQNCSQSCA